MNKNSKIILIIVIAFLILYQVYQTGVRDATPWTGKDEKEAVQSCKKWGGEVVYDREGNYFDCAINGRLGTD